MSIFRDVSMPCPTCATPVAFELVLSLNAGRRPDQRQAILDGSFQRQTCPACDARFRVDPQFTFVDLPHGQYIGVWPQARRADWQACAAQTEAGFEAAYGKGAPPEARALGAGLSVRAVFGWPALVEKLVARDAGIDDTSLEVAKVAVMSSRDETPLPGSRELRAVRADGDAVSLAWIDVETESVERTLRVPRTLIADIEADPARWQALRDDVADGIVVDFQREMAPA